ncbi:hypothetical protein BSL78_25154 [Apostichopus japonicus]|uniref:Uncharacterized protein n=1 Tax=Stichopus japonicus TaxID=307972 RepID=A0A2G8JQN2_STIJA|nr:hypothetical protein BSL78_25154 [Apostichopus japonicus]
MTASVNLTKLASDLARYHVCFPFETAPQSMHISRSSTMKPLVSVQFQSVHIHVICHGNKDAKMIFHNSRHVSAHGSDVPTQEEEDKLHRSMMYLQRSIMYLHRSTIYLQRSLIYLHRGPMYLHMQEDAPTQEHDVPTKENNGPTQKHDFPTQEHDVPTQKHDVHTTEPDVPTQEVHELTEETVITQTPAPTR